MLSSMIIVVDGSSFAGGGTIKKLLSFEEWHGLVTMEVDISWLLHRSGASLRL
jgi:hypothetical protein